MWKIVPEVLVDAKNRKVHAVAQAALRGTRTACPYQNDKNNIKNKHDLVIGFVI
ncbi:hypothetical protein [Limnohabitans sp. Bal53]|jgi:hypothetical protein|uniref:hypothetical protein n=1 Tax=Limnohabitans sp. Bal53 TaxID=1977910 RepID=UPI0013050181|nr:hypothetical protein [Limnohabitans sp. Bal53]MDP4772396.1 hypothetical protein [Limnohabitans sp.]